MSLSSLMYERLNKLVDGPTALSVVYGKFPEELEEVRQCLRADRSWIGKPLEITREDVKLSPADYALWLNEHFARSDWFLKGPWTTKNTVRFEWVAHN